MPVRGIVMRFFRCTFAGMRQIIILLSFVSAVLTAAAQVELPAHCVGDSWRIDAQIDGAPVKVSFTPTVDTVSISRSIADYLVENGFAASRDVIHVGDDSLLVITDLEIAGLHLRGLHAAIVEGQRPSLIVGTTALSQLASVSQQDGVLLLQGKMLQLSVSQVPALRRQAELYKQRGEWQNALKAWLQIRNAGQLTDYGLLQIAVCQFQLHRWTECLSSCQQWVNYYAKAAPVASKDLICLMAGSSYQMTGRLQDAINWHARRLTLTTDLSQLANVHAAIAVCQTDLKEYTEAKGHFDQAVSLMLRACHTSLDQISQGHYHEASTGNGLGFIFSQYAYLCRCQQDMSASRYWQKLAAKVGYKE